MPTTPRHGFQKWSSGFTQSDVILNGDLDILDVRLSLAVRSRTENAPLGGDAAGDAYIITGSPSGAFSAFTEDYIAYYDGSSWYQFEPVQGQVAWVDDDAEGVTYDGSGWTVTSGDISAVQALAESQPFTFEIATVAEIDYVLWAYAPFAGTIDAVGAVCDSGTCTLTGKIGATPLGGTANSVSSSYAEQAHASANSFSKGDLIQFTISSNSSCLELAGIFFITRSS